MKTIGYKDLVSGFIYEYKPRDGRETELFRRKRWERFFEGYKDMRGLGNVAIVRLDGQKVRSIGKRGL